MNRSSLSRVLSRHQTVGHQFTLSHLFRRLPTGQNAACATDHFPSTEMNWTSKLSRVPLQIHGYFSNKTRIIFILSLALFLHWAMPAAIDNDVIGDPTIECGDTSLTFSVKTRKLFPGRIFVKGQIADTNCVRSDFARQQTSTPMMDLTFGACGMRGQRADEPRGILYSVTLVVSFHPMFITKVDRAYHVKCFFEETLRTITVGIDVSMISTADATVFRSSSGTCTYTIHEGTTAGGSASIGPQISVAQVGDKIVHKWTCTDTMYGILVQSCYVTDGFGTQAEVIDRRGCPLDPILISTISYDSALNEAFAESMVFKFADRPGVWFHCELQMCLKMSQACEGVTPPNCGLVGGSVPNSTTGVSNEPSAPTMTESNPPVTSSTSTASPTTLTSTVSIANTTVPMEESSEGGTDPPSAPGIIPPLEYHPSSDIPPTPLPPAPSWSSTTTVNPETPPAASLSPNPNQTNPPPVPSGYHNADSILAELRKRILLQQRLEDSRVATSTVPPIYEDEEIIQDTGMDEHTTKSRRHRSSTSVVSRKWPRVGDKMETQPMLYRTTTVGAKRRSTTNMVKKGHVKRAAPGWGPEPTTVHTNRRPVRIKDRDSEQMKKISSWEETEPIDQNEDRFRYKDTLSNRLIIFDVDEDPPPDYKRWSQNRKQSPDHASTMAVSEKPSSDSTKRVDSEQVSSRRATSAGHDICVVSTQGLIIILAASGALSAMLILLLVITCFRYRVVNVKTATCNCDTTRALPNTLDLIGSRRNNESSQRIGNQSGAAIRRQQRLQISTFNSSNSDEQPMRTCAQERWKRR